MRLYRITEWYAQNESPPFADPDMEVGLAGIYYEATYSLAKAVRFAKRRKEIYPHRKYTIEAEIWPSLHLLEYLYLKLFHRDEDFGTKFMQARGHKMKHIEEVLSI